MCPIFNGCEDTAVWSWRVQVKLLSVGMDENEVHKEKINTGHDLVARVVNSAALVKQERQDDLRRATRTVAKKDEMSIEIEGWIFEHLLRTVAIYWDHLHNE